MKENTLPSVLGKLPQGKGNLLFFETLQQLSKDLDLDSSQLSHLERNMLHELEQIVTLHLQTYVASKPSALQQLLYRADISEKQYKKALQDSEGKNTERFLAPLFIFRAFTKCYTRMLAAEGKL